MIFTGFYDINGNKIFVGDYLKHKEEGIEGIVENINGEYMFGDGFELENYGADVVKLAITDENSI